MSQNRILFVFEGERKEKEFFDSFSKLLFPSDNVIAIGCYGNNIYELYKNLQQENFSEFIDVVSLLKDYGCKSLDEYKKEDFGEIYLFFDYDPHDSKAEERTLIEMLNVFDNETEQGMLFINYPVVESMYDTSHCISLDKFINHSVLKDECSGFKASIGRDIGSYNSGKLKKYSSARWARLFILHCQKANFIINANKMFPNKELHQISLHNSVIKQESIPVLSSFPLMYYCYHGSSSFGKLEEIMNMGYKIDLGCNICDFTIALFPRDFQAGREIACKCGSFNETLGLADATNFESKSQEVMPIILKTLLSNYPDEFYPAPLKYARQAVGIIVIRIDTKTQQIIIDDKLNAYIAVGYSPQENEELGLIVYSKAPDITGNYVQVKKYIEKIISKRRDLFV